MRMLLSLLFLMSLAPPLAADAALRPDSLVLNQTLALSRGASLEVPLYLTRRGDYFAEVILEAPDGRPRSDGVDIDLDVSITRREEALFERAVRTELGSGRPIATLFWLTSDREVPIKTPLTLALNINDVASAAPDDVLRIQIRRKKNFTLFPR